MKKYLLPILLTSCVTAFAASEHDNSLWFIQDDALHGITSMSFDTTNVWITDGQPSSTDVTYNTSSGYSTLVFVAGRKSSSEVVQAIESQGGYASTPFFGPLNFAFHGNLTVNAGSGTYNCPNVIFAQGSYGLWPLFNNVWAAFTDPSTNTWAYTAGSNIVPAPDVGTHTSVAIPLYCNGNYSAPTLDLIVCQGSVNTMALVLDSSGFNAPDFCNEYFPVTTQPLSHVKAPVQKEKSA